MKEVNALAYEDYLDDLLHKMQNPKNDPENILNEDEDYTQLPQPDEGVDFVQLLQPEEEDSIENVSNEYQDDMDFLKDFDDQLMSELDEEFIKDFERELDEEVAKVETSSKNPKDESLESFIDNTISSNTNDISEDDSIDFYNELDDIVREVNSKLDEPDSNSKEKEVKTEESAGSMSETSYSDDEIWRQFITDDGESAEDENTNHEEKQNIDDSNFHEKEEKKNLEELDIMELLNSVPDYDSLSGVGELLGKDENNEPVAVDDVISEDIFSSDVEELYYEGEDIPIISPDSIKENEKENIISNEKSEETQKKEEGFISKFLKKFKTPEKKGNKKSDVSNSDTLDENSTILNENEPEDIKSKKGKKNSKEKKIKQKEKKQPKLPKIMEPVEPEKPLPKLPVILICILSGSILVFVLIITNLMSYSISIANAKELFRNQKYNKAYNNLIGLEIKDSDETFYNQLRVIMELNRQYSSYENFQQLEMQPESLNALLKGVRQYDKYLEEANNLGISNHFQKIMDSIETILSEKYNLSLEQAREINTIEDNVIYTQKINSILQ